MDEHRQGVATNGARAESRSEQGWGKDTLELHSGDITAECLRRVKLRIEGKAVGSTTTALLRGLVWHKARDLCYTGGWANYQAKVERAVTSVLDEARASNRPVSAGASEAMPEIREWVADNLERYAERVAPRVAKLIAIEPDVRIDFTLGGRKVAFVSHLDVLYRDHDGRLCIDDDKTGEDAPTSAYLARNLQLAMYAVVCKRGFVHVEGEWVDFCEWPRVYWIHVRHLAPFGRKTKMQDIDPRTGEVVEVEYMKGETRPLDRVVREAPISEGGIDKILDEFHVRAGMALDGEYPATPSPVGCTACESRVYCGTFTGGEEVSQ